MRASAASRATLLLATAVAACVASPVRRTETPAPDQPSAEVQFELRNELGSGWFVRYVQVYADGWLLWQGEVSARTTSLGPFTLAGAGYQEIHVRAVAGRGGTLGGRLESDRRVYRFRPGGQRLYIRLAPAGLGGSAFRVRLQAR